jgi:pimeloyl-ACP methyl ester carboxylesterase
MQFRIDSDEGLLIRGAIELPARPKAAVVIVHGFKGFKEWGFFPWVSAQLCEHGFAACRFDLSRNGVGDDPEQFGRLDLFADDTYSIQLADLRAVIRHCRSQESLRNLPLFLLGHSRGAAIAILGAHEVPDLEGVITWAGISATGRWDAATKSSWRRDGFLDVLNQRTGQMMRLSTAILDDFDRHADALNMERALMKMRVPLLVIHGDHDETVPVVEARRISTAALDSSLVVIGGGTHTFNAIHPLVNVTRELALASEVTAHFIHAYA